MVVHAVGRIFSVQAMLRGSAPCLSEPPRKRSRICLHCFHSLHPSHESAQFGGGSEILGGGVSLTGGSKIANGRAGTPSVCHQPGANRGRPHLPDGPEPLPHLLGVDEGLRQLAGDAHQEPTRGYRGARFQGDGRLGRSYLSRIHRRTRMGGVRTGEGG